MIEGAAGLIRVFSNKVGAEEWDQAGRGVKTMYVAMQDEVVEPRRDALTLALAVSASGLGKDANVKRLLRED